MTVSPLPPLAQGSIIWANVADSRGNKKLRPVVIISATSEIMLDEPIVAVAISSSHASPTPSNMIELPWRRGRHPMTKLARRSAAVCNWVVVLRPSDVTRVEGAVPSKYLLEILELHKKLNRADE